ncbi:MAG: glycosyltransferase family 4 protein [Clostridia bacterium]|nr:glycosyltransferase family 4 protein [Clostridia bacterium]
MPRKKSDKLRIAMLGHKRIPSREGGVEIVVGELSTRMVEKGYEVTCYNRKGHHIGGSSFDEEQLKEYKGVRIKSVWTVEKRGLAAMTASFAAAVRAAFGRFDVVHFHAEGPCAMLWLPKLFGKRCVATIHGLDHQRAKWGRFASWYIRFGEKCAVRFADEIIVLSENVQDYFTQVYGRKTVFVPNGVTRPEIKPVDEIKKLYGLEKDSYLLYLGRLVPEKGVKYLVEAFKQINTDKKLVIAGGSSDSSDYEAQLKELANGDERIIFTGFIQGQVLEELYSNAYIYILPSDLEGMPLSLLEAMSYGNCCLTSDIPECAKVTECYGVTFRKGDVDDLKDKLLTLCNNSFVVEDLQRQSADYICNKYNWDDVTAQTLSLYGLKDAVADVKALEEEKNESLVGK